MRLASLAFTLPLLLVAASASAAVPAPSTSSIPACVLSCPSGDMTVTVTVRDLASFPLNASQVTLDFSGCPGPTFCAHCADIYTLNLVTRTVSKFTGPNGAVTFSLCAGGETCAGSLVRISADGVPLGSVPYASPDQNGDGTVNGTDQAGVSARISAASPDADLDCSGVADAADLAILNAHLGHTCAVIVPSAPGTWGTLKIRYR